MVLASLSRGRGLRKAEQDRGFALIAALFFSATLLAIGLSTHHIAHRATTDAADRRDALSARFLALGATELDSVLADGPLEFERVLSNGLRTSVRAEGRIGADGSCQIVARAVCSGARRSYTRRVTDSTLCAP